MGPICNNYGTFAVSPGLCEVEVWRDEDYQNSNIDKSWVAYSETGADDAGGLDCRLRKKGDGSFGVRLGTDRGEVVLVHVDEDITLVRGLHEGDVVSHVDGQRLRGSLRTAITCVQDAAQRETIQLRVLKSSEYDSNSSCTNNLSRNRSSRGRKRSKKYRVVQHLVRQGDSVEGLAAQYGTTTEQIRSDNRRHFPVGEAGFLCPGQTLMLRAALSNVPPDDGMNTHGYPAQDAYRKCSSSTSNKFGSMRVGTERGLRKSQVLYEVQEGDSLESICARLGADEAEVRRCNRRMFPVGEAGSLEPGKLLTVFASECHSLVAGKGSEYPRTGEAPGP